MMIVLEKNPVFFSETSKHDFIVNICDLILDVKVYNNIQNNKLRLDFFIGDSQNKQIIIDKINHKIIDIYIEKNIQTNDIKPIAKKINVLGVSYNQRIIFTKNVNVYKHIHDGNVLHVYASYQNSKVLT